MERDQTRLPDEAVPLLIECAADPNDGLRLNAVVALRGGAPVAAGDVRKERKRSTWWY